MRPGLVHGSQQLPGLVEDDGHLMARHRPDVHGPVRRLPTPVMGEVPADHELAAALHPSHRGASVGAEELQLVLGEGLLPGRAGKVGFQDVGVGRVDHGRFGRAGEQVLGVGHQILVQGVVLCHQDRD